MAYAWLEGCGSGLKGVAGVGVDVWAMWRNRGRGKQSKSASIGTVFWCYGFERWGQSIG